MKKNDLLLAAGILLAALVLYLAFRPGEAGAWVVIDVGGTEIARYDLSQDRIVTLGEEDYNILEISGGTAAVVDANCGDQTCVRTGRISREGETIVCLPHRLTVRVAGGEAAPFDGAAR